MSLISKDVQSKIQKANEATDEKKKNGWNGPYYALNEK